MRSEVIIFVCTLILCACGRFTNRADFITGMILEPSLRSVSDEQFNQTEVDPLELTHQLSHAKSWLTIAFDETEGAVTNVISKRWGIEHAAGETFFSEAAFTSFKIDADEAISATKLRIQLPQEIQLASFLILPNPENAPIRCSKIVTLGTNRFLLEFGNSPTKVLLVAATDSADLESFRVNGPADEQIGVWTTPLGQNDVSSVFQSMDVSVSLPKKDHFFHYAPGVLMTVTIDSSFPAAFLPQLESAVAKWNIAIGHEALIIDTIPSETKTVDCLSGSKICIRWKGSANFAWTGYSGIGMSAFDPLSGEIIGGVVQIENSAKESNLTQAPADINALITENKMTAEDAAKIFMQKEKFATLRRPNPEKLVEGLFLHELGHINGLSHDFRGSLDADQTTWFTTVMDYPPFPLAHKLTDLGSRDLIKVDRVYRGKQPDSQSKTCSDFDSIPIRRDGFLIQLDSMCNLFDVGSSVDWYLLTGKYGDQGFLTLIPFPFQPPMLYLQPNDNTVAMHLGFALKDPAVRDADKLKIESALCQSSDQKQIASLIKSRLNYDLDCDWKILSQSSQHPLNAGSVLRSRRTIERL